MFNLDDCIGFITNKASKQIANAFNDDLLQHNITRVQWIALYNLMKNENLSQSQLADTLNIKTSTMVRLIDRLENEKLVQRNKSHEDRRITIVSLTPMGKEKINQLLYVGEDFSRKASRGISEKELEIFKNVLSKMVNNVLE